MYENESLLEVAIELMEKKRKPHSLMSIAKDVFEIKGLKINDSPELLAQFQIDFMLSGCFICCGEDTKGNKVWSLKNRQKHEMLDREGIYLEDPYNTDEDVIKNELKDDYQYEDTDYNTTYTEDEEVEEKDDIEEELSGIYDNEGQPAKKEKYIDEDEDDDDDDEDDDEDDVDDDLS